MPVTLHPAPASPAHGLVVLLPGIGDRPDAFVEHGFVDRIHAADDRLDVIAADAHLGYYRTDSLVERLHSDVIAPIAHNYRDIWLVGVSMGGLGAAIYASEHENLVEGVILIAPLMDYQNVIEEIRLGGGLSAWRPPALDEVDDPLRRRVYQAWVWARELEGRNGVGPQVFAGCGSGDKFRDANLLLASLLPAERDVTLPGGHEWVVWGRLFNILAEGSLARTD